MSTFPDYIIISRIKFECLVNLYLAVLSKLLFLCVMDNLDRMYKEMTNPSEKLIDLHKKIKSAEGYMPVTPEYNHSTSAAMKNRLDYFLEEYYFKPSAIVSYSPGGFGGINAAQQMRLIFAELGAPSIPSSFPISRVHEVFDENGKLIHERYEMRVKRFLDEFEWYMEALKNQRETKCTPY